MEKIVTENLFLLEFLVDKCVINPNAVSKEIRQVVGETCVCFKFLDNDPLDICEADFSPKRNYTEDSGNMKSGKSCLFALSPNQAEEAMVKFNVDVCVFKKLPTDSIPDKIQIGNTVVSIVDLFNEILQLLQSADKPETVSRTLKDSYAVTNPNDEVIGNIDVFLRMSCFGKLIVTQFQMNLEDKSVFFKDKEGHSLYKYRKASKAEVKDQDDTSSSLKCKPLRPIPTDRSIRSSFKNNEDQCEDCNPEIVPYEFRYPDAYCPVSAGHNPLDDKGCYQEIGAEMNGNALRIRVHKNKGTIKRIDSNNTDELLNEEKFKPCNDVSPKWLNNQADGCYCLRPTPRRAACMDKQVLSLKPGDDTNNPFAFRVSGCPDAVNNNVTVVSPTSTRPDGMQVTEISDPNKDVFILKIGKKSEGTDKKANLELELITPKGIERKPVPKKETRETQYLESDAGPEPGKAKSEKKGKGKGAKGGKGGKGKKGDGASGDGKDIRSSKQSISEIRSPTAKEQNSTKPLEKIPEKNVKFNDEKDKNKIESKPEVKPEQVQKKDKKDSVVNDNQKKDSIIKGSRRMDNTPKDDIKKDSPPKENPKKDNPPKDNLKKDNPPKDNQKINNPPKDNLKKDNPSKPNLQKDNPPKENPKKDTPLKDNSKKDTPPKDNLKKDTPPKEKPKSEPKTQTDPKPTPNKNQNKLDSGTGGGMTEMPKIFRESPNEKCESIHRCFPCCMQNTGIPIMSPYQASYCSYDSWNVPQNVKLVCSKGKIRSVTACCCWQY